MSRLMKLANAVMLVLFLSWAGFQYNDPDIAGWIAVYALAALWCVLALLGRFSRPAALLYIAACGLWALYLAVQVVADTEFFFEERGREAMGLGVCVIWTAVLWKTAGGRGDVGT